MKALKKYYIGFAVLAVATVALLVVVLTKGAAHKQDQRVNDVAYSISVDLNKYVKDNQEIPERLGSATNEDIPSQISYNKESASQYEFCVTYSEKSGGSSLNAQSILYQGLSGNFSNSYYGDTYTPRTRTSLTVSSYSWQKGETCYTVKPVFYNNYNRSYYSPDYGL